MPAHSPELQGQGLKDNPPPHSGGPQASLPRSLAASSAAFRRSLSSCAFFASADRLAAARRSSSCGGTHQPDFNTASRET